MNNHISVLGFLAATFNILFHFDTFAPPSQGAGFHIVGSGTLSSWRGRGGGNEGCACALTKGENGDESESSYIQPK